MRASPDGPYGLAVRTSSRARLAPLLLAVLALAGCGGGGGGKSPSGMTAEVTVNPIANPIAKITIAGPSGKPPATSSVSPIVSSRISVLLIDMMAPSLCRSGMLRLGRFVCGGERRFTME